MFLDRRVDSDQLLRLWFDDQPLRHGLEHIAKQQRLGVSFFEDLVYFGPRETTGKIRTLALLRKTEIGKLPASVKTKLLARRALKWADLTTPKELLDDLAQQAGIQMTGTKQVPHDLWAAGDLPAMTWADRLTLIAAAFDLTYAVARDGSVRLVPIPEQVVTVKDYPLGRHRPEEVSGWEKTLGSVRIAVRDRRIFVRGRVEDQELVAGLLQGKKPPPPKRKVGGREVYSLKVKETAVGKVIRDLAKQLNLELRIDEDAIRKAGKSLDTPVSFQLDKASINEVFRAALRPAGLTHTLRNGVLKIRPL